MTNHKALVLTFAAALAAGALFVQAQEKPATPPATAPAKTGEVAGGQWAVAEGALAQSSDDTPALVLFGDKTWKDYTIELEAQKTEGDEGFLVAVRAKDASHLVWFNVGGWGNSRTAFEGLNSEEDKTDFGEQQTYGPFVEVVTGKWHKLKVTVAGNKVEGFLDDKSACKFDVSFNTAGEVGIGTWSTHAKFRNIKVTGSDGKVLWEGLPAVKK